MELGSRLLLRDQMCALAAIIAVESTEVNGEDYEVRLDELCLRYADIDCCLQFESSPSCP